MRHANLFVIVLVVGVSLGAQAAQDPPKQDVIKTDRGDLTIHFLGHGTLMFEHAGKLVHVDPWSRVADYTKMPPADLILITHEHGDHLDLKALQALRQDKTQVVLAPVCAERVKGGIVMKNGERKTVQDIQIEAVPAYNIVHKRSNY